MKRLLYISLVLLGVMFTTTACNDWLDVSPETEKKKEEMFSKESGYRNVLIGAYIRMKSNSLYGEEMVYGTVEMLAQHWNNTTSGSKENYLKKYDYKASAVENAFYSGDEMEAERLSREALKWSKIGLFIGIATYLLYFAFIGWAVVDTMLYGLD